MKQVDVLLVGGPLDGKVIKTESTTPYIRYALTEVRAMRSPTPEEIADPNIPKFTYQLHPIVGNRETWYIGRLIDPGKQTFDDAMSQILRRYANASA